MAAKFAFVLCASVMLVEVISAQCIGNPAIVGNGIIADGIFAANDIANGARFVNDLAYTNVGARGLAYDAYGMGPRQVAPTSGGGFAVISSSPIAPTGLSVASENVIEGVVAVTGQLPVLSAVALEATLPTAGTGAISYGCGDGSIGITSELAPKPYAAPLAGELPYSGPLGAGLPYRGLSPLTPAGRGCGTL